MVIRRIGNGFILYNRGIRFAEMIFGYGFITLCAGFLIRLCFLLRIGLNERIIRRFINAYLIIFAIVELELFNYENILS